MWFGASGLLIGITSAILILVVSFNKKNELLRSWIYFNISVSIWGFGSFWVSRCQDANSALFAWRIAHIGVIFIPITFYHFVYIFTNQKHKLSLLFLYSLGIIILYANFFSSMFISRTEYLFESLYYARSDHIYYKLFFCFWIFTVFYGHILLFFRYLKSDVHIEKIRIQYLFFSVLVGFLGGSMNFFPIIGFDVYPYGNSSIPIYCILVTFVILRFRLMDISLVITRTGIFVLVYSLVLGIPFALAFGWQDKLIALLADNWWIIPLVSSTVLATVGPYIYLYIQKRAEDRLMQEQRRYQTTLRQASSGMSRIKNRKKLLNLIVRIVNRTVNLDHTSIYLYNKKEEAFIIEAFRNTGKFTGKTKISVHSKLIEYIYKHKESVAYEEIKQRAKDYDDKFLVQIEKQLRDLNAVLVVPSVAQDKVVGLILLGRKKSEKLFSGDDIAVFSILANQAALAIENALFYEDAQKTQEQLFQAEKMATIGTMADGLSHQINNRLHALGFIAGDALDSIQLKEGVENPREIKELLEELKNSLNRIQNNVTQGGEIVQGLLRYTRKGEAGFSFIALKDLVKSSKEMASYKVKIDQIDIVEDYPENLPQIYGNFTQLQEVVFNIIDNAYDAIMQRKNEMKEEGYRGKIHISTNFIKDKIEINFLDNGIGVKDEDLEKLFTPFFTTKASSKKGTGLGLYVIQKIIEGNHKGRVSMSSDYGRGTLTTLLLPSLRV